jgi:carotenoid cleavage dioxygenase-like enzyme
MTPLSYGMTMFPTHPLQQYARPLGDHDDSTDWGIVKLDHKIAAAKGEPGTVPSAVRWSSPSCYPYEPIFVAHPDATSEDQGVLLAQVYDGARREAFLLVLDAQTLKEVARCWSGLRLPVQFHGKFIEEFK